jgi:hypothetical protein
MSASKGQYTAETVTLAEGDIRTIRLTEDGKIMVDATATVSGGATAANQTSGAQRVKTSAPTSTHAGANVATSSSAAALTSQATTIGYIIVTALLANTAPIFLARGAGVTTGTGIELNPGDSIPLPCENANEWYAISAAAQNLRFVAV